ncbi:NAD-dependent epimerase/dehydratase family protein [Ekhidna sp.]|uniref:NAD-dependent epimerase/dehydratase family protein n=1 Tax=Ekhidna sp. TaxID=2608089 RepID=UPI003C7D67C4
MKKKAVVIGASGLVGKQLVKLMLKDDRYESILVVARRSYDIKDPRVVELQIEDFDDLSKHAAKMNGHDFYCALGTTRKKAGSKEAFLKVDVEYPLTFAQIVRKQKDFQQLLVVSAVSANSSSPLFYNKAKGELEDQLQDLNLKSLKIFQPSLLLGDRKEFRFFEEVAKLISKIASFFVIGSKKAVGAIRDVEVAKSMIELAHQNEEGFRRIKPGEMVDIAYSS